MTNASRIILVGASVRAAAESAKKAGLGVIGVDQFGDVDCRQCCEAFHLLDDLERSLDLTLIEMSRQYPGVPIHVVGGFQTEVTLERLKLGHRPEGDVVNGDWRDPVWLRSLADDVGMRFPKTIRPSSGSFERVLKSEVGHGRWLVKQWHRSGGLGVRWTSSSGADSNNQYVQQWIAGRRYGITYFSVAGEAVLLGGGRSLHTRKGSLPFVYGGSFGPVALPEPIRQRLRCLGDHFVNRTRYQGLFGADIVIDSHGELWLLEINARWTASTELIEWDLSRRGIWGDDESLIGWVHAMQTISADNKASLLDRIKQVGQTLEGQTEQRTMLKKVVFASHSGVFRSGRVTMRLPNPMQIRDLPKEGTHVEKGSPIVSLIVPWSEISSLRRVKETIGAARSIRDSVQQG
ncbi:ATP-grasp domain protein [Planctomycetes bacterium CA13]|uniref:ATP-grasp domain protein n=1 Tax=Novipirellula herctigrandis TaxID=2527986 RepID=A0A5C5YN29_9BACT|nr:ATP-grasp domain protein [Planctomycetes bacterium CA13]